MDNHESNYLDNMYYKFNIKKSYNVKKNSASNAYNRIHEARLSKSLTIKQVSIQSNLTETQIHNIETNKSTPTLATLKKLESVLDKDFWYLGNYDSLEENTLGERIYKCRLFLGYGRKEFAQILGVGYRSLEKWERDLVTPSKKNMDILKKYINKLYIICRKKL
ncbi:helix-turn-helix domain-containing protein [Hathewaya massiliensis]|uniref:helix-turn-helix domain-containing protein n=1 Tax=Hathewaya massiliensis TaxID=1964382 RepID=UPI00163CB5CD|nr:helix-turn-helix domain-containing protein [Hathewaya massiliensis]